MEKINFQNGITKVNAETFNKFQNNINETSYFLKLTADVAKGGTITIPAYYKVGVSALDVFYMGEKLLLSSDAAGTDGHYQEVGEANAVSNQIKLTSDWGCDSGEYFEFIVRR